MKMATAASCRKIVFRLYFAYRSMASEFSRNPPHYCGQPIQAALNQNGVLSIPLDDTPFN
jgi:hypothetical protein